MIDQSSKLEAQSENDLPAFELCEFWFVFLLPFTLEL